MSQLQMLSSSYTLPASILQNISQELAGKSKGKGKQEQQRAEAQAEGATDKNEFYAHWAAFPFTSATTTTIASALSWQPSAADRVDV